MPRGDVETAFGRLESRMAEIQPEVLDALRVYGDYEAALRQADACFAALRRLPRVSTTDSSGHDGC